MLVWLSVCSEVQVFAYSPADASAIPKPQHLLPHLNPDWFKEAIVRRLLKKSGLDSTQKKNYRPVSNLSFLPKLLERVAQARLEVFLDSSDLSPLDRV